jgi:hypothetical protein
VPWLDAAIDDNLRRARVEETLERLNRHPQEILSHLTAEDGQRGGGSGGRQPLDTGGET